jgi:ribosome biogenesis GTPase
LSETGLVLVSYGSQGIVERADGSRAACSYRRSVGRPYCGDRVDLESTATEDLVVSRILPRDNVFVRADARQNKQVVAANLDQVLIVLAPAPQPSRDLVERYLVAVHSLGVSPLIVLNKSELAFPDDKDNPLHRLAEYAELGCTVIHTSCKGHPGTDALQGELRGKVSILVGQSGVGKSSLVNRLLPDLELQTGDLSRVTGKGTHTTTTTIMYALPCGGRLIDSPGVWEYGLWAMSPEELESGFTDFAPFIGHCRFNDCRHEAEPGCAVRSAVDDGAIKRWRYEAYLRLLRQSAA